MSKENGGPAFPREDYAANGGGGGLGQEGMTLRDYFAAKAIPIAWKAFEDGYFTNDNWDSINDGVAECAYQMADAMLAVRNA